MSRHVWQTPSGELVWYSWNSGTTSATASATYSVTTNGHVWSSWNNDIGTTGTIMLPSTRAVWAAWNGDIITVNGITTTNQYARMGQQEAAQKYGAPQSQRGRRLTPEEVAAEEQRQAERELRLAEMAKKQAEEAAQRLRAGKRAEALLYEMLSPQQVEELKTKHHFHLEVISKDGERRRYQIQRGRHGNVKQVDEQGNFIRSLCVHPTMNVPDADTMLAQKLYLENAEEELLRVANITNFAAIR